MSIDLEELAAVVRLLKDAEFSEFTYSRGDTVLSIRRGDLPAASSATPSPVAPATAAPSSVAPAPVRPAAPPPAAPPSAPVEGPAVLAPLLGTFYSAPKPGEAPFVKPGDRVTAETVVCIVEVMKLMNSVPAGIAGTIAAVLVRDGDLVEHGQPLFTVVPEA